MKISPPTSFVSNANGFMIMLKVGSSPWFLRLKGKLILSKCLKLKSMQGLLKPKCRHVMNISNIPLSLTLPFTSMQCASDILFSNILCQDIPAPGDYNISDSYYQSHGEILIWRNPMLPAHGHIVNFVDNTACDSEIEWLTSFEASLINPNRSQNEQSTRRRRRLMQVWSVTSASRFHCPKLYFTITNLIMSTSWGILPGSRAFKLWPFVFLRNCKLPLASKALIMIKELGRGGRCYNRVDGFAVSLSGFPRL